MTRLVESAGYRLERHIPLAMQREAVSQTANYVQQKMQTALPVHDPSEFLKTAVAACKIPDGLVLECGVWRARSTKLLARLFPHEQVFGFDSFQGLPESWRAGFNKSTFAVNVIPKVPANVELKCGWFKDTLPSFLAEHGGPIKFLHIDCDLYSSTLDVLRSCRERLIQGTVIAFDEYFNYPGWQEGEYRAFHECVRQDGLQYEYVCYTLRHEQVAVRIL